MLWFRVAGAARSLAWLPIVVLSLCSLYKPWSVGYRVVTNSRIRLCRGGLLTLVSEGAGWVVFQPFGVARTSRNRMSVACLERNILLPFCPSYKLLWEIMDEHLSLPRKEIMDEHLSLPRKERSRSPGARIRVFDQRNVWFCPCVRRISLGLSIVGALLFASGAEGVSGSFRLFRLRAGGIRECPWSPSEGEQ